MLKKIFLISGIVLLAGLLIAGAVNRTLAKTGSESSEQGGYGRGNGIDVGNGHGNGTEAGNGHSETGLPGANAAHTPLMAEGTALEFAAGLSPEEEQALLFMREEEKLAYDVYTALYEMWGLNTFQNISRSEQAHTEAVLRLLNQYNLSDPASSEAGVFANADLQALYDQLMQQGSQSLVDAIRVGAAIEEIDILDLQSRLAQVTNAEVQQVFTNLLNGSSNHLRAFAAAYQNQTGETYMPEYLDPSAYDAIVESATDSGTGGQGGGYRGGRP